MRELIGCNISSENVLEESMRSYLLQSVVDAGWGREESSVCLVLGINDRLLRPDEDGLRADRHAPRQPDEYFLED